MLEKKTTILLALFYLTVSPVVAQTKMHAIASIGLPDEADALPANIERIDSEAYRTVPTLSAVAPASQTASATSFTYYRQATSLLLHLKDDHNQVTLQVTNAIGKTVQLLSEENLAGGFYELPVLDQWLRSGVYAVRVVINEQVSTFQTIR